MTAKEYLHFLLINLVDFPGCLSIKEVLDDRGQLLAVTLHAGDMRTIIGRGGRTIDALRTVMRIYGIQHNQHISIKLIEE